MSAERALAYDHVLPFRTPPQPLLALALAVTLVASKSAAVTPGPFRNFISQWSGRGQIVASNGHRESIRCRADYSEAKDGAALNQTIVCASESFKLNTKSYVEASGESVQGYWNEAARDVTVEGAGVLLALDSLA